MKLIKIILVWAFWLFFLGGLCWIEVDAMLRW